MPSLSTTWPLISYPNDGVTIAPTSWESTWSAFDTRRSSLRRFSTSYTEHGVFSTVPSSTSWTNVASVAVSLAPTACEKVCFQIGGMFNVDWNYSAPNYSATGVSLWIDNTLLCSGTHGYYSADQHQFCTELCASWEAVTPFVSSSHTFRIKHNRTIAVGSPILGGIKEWSFNITTDIWAKAT